MRQWTAITILLFSACDGGMPPDDDAGVVAECASDEDCDDGLFCNGVERCAPGAPEAQDNGCAPANEPACPDEDLFQCSEADDVCETRCDRTEDADGDGVIAPNCGGPDCDDTDRDRYPGNAEVCDLAGHDEDCDPETFGTTDADGDGEIDDRCFNTADDGEVFGGTDCDDRRGYVGPGQTEVCNGLDDDCNGSVDEGVMVERFRDEDGDGDGAEGAAPVMVCPDATGYSTTNGDCDDTTPLFRSPPWFELCDGADNDCDMTVDEDLRAVAWYTDADGDGFGDAFAPVEISCAPIPTRSLLGTDCDDTRAGVHPGSPEQCNGLDDDCNGRLDFFDPVGMYGEDEDGDGVANARCVPGGDCDDTDFLSGGDVPEICDDRVDNDCDGAVDEAETDPVLWYPDLDGDYWGDEVSGVAATQCERLARASTRVHDCDDTNPLSHPGAPDLCDARDDDCDGDVDEDAAHRVVFEDVDRDSIGDGAAQRIVCGALPAAYSAVPGDCAPTDPTLSLRWPDLDGDGIGGGEPLLMCGPGDASMGGDCDDTNPLLSTGCVELCNGVDDDMDGMVDETGGMGCENASTTSWTCVGGSCVFGGCTGNGANCDTLPGNGCEADLGTSPAHCGACGMSCGVGAGCGAMTCTSRVIEVEIAANRGCALRDNGRVACWGMLPADMATIGVRDEPTPETLLVEGGVLITDADWFDVGPVGWCVGRDTDGVLRCATSGDSYDVGAFGAGGPRNTAMARSLPVGLAAVSTDRYHGCGITSGGSAVCWGRNSDGQLGRGSVLDASFSPAPVIGISGATAVDVGTLHSCVVAGNDAWCWGQAFQGRLGTPSFVDATTPVRFPLVGVSTDPALDVACSDEATCVLRTSGAIECAGVVAQAGGNWYETTPTLVGTVAGATEIEGDDDQFCVASATTGAWCFGSDLNGELGNGPGQVDSMTPGQVVGLTANAVSVDVAESHACAVIDVGDGEVWCWGSQTSGQLGTRTGDLEVPGRVLNLP